MLFSYNSDHTQERESSPNSGVGHVLFNESASRWWEVDMEYLNFDLEIQPGSGGTYLVVARSNAGSGRAMMRFPYDAPALENALLRVQNALLRSAALRRQVLSPEAQAVQDFGERLFRALMTGEVLHLYNVSGALAEQQGSGKGLRVRLQVLAPELAALPWEFLYDPGQGDYLCFQPRRSLVRYLDVPQPIQPLTVQPPLLVAAMVASPSDQAQLDVEHEKQRLRDALGPLEQRGLLKLRWVEGQTPHDLQKKLLERNWHVFHFIGHGGFDPRSQEGVLALANDQGKTHLLSATDLGRLLAQRSSLRLVVLNACQGAMGNKTDLFSSTAATLARKGLPAVLAMQYEITDQAAIEFTRGFYVALAAGIPVDEAVTQARTSINLGVARTLEWATPVLFMRAPDGVLFDVPPPTTIVPPPSGQQPRTGPAGPATGQPQTGQPQTGRPPQPPPRNQGYAAPPGYQPPLVFVPTPAPPLAQPAASPKRKRSGAGLGVTLGLVAVLLLAALAGGVYFVASNLHLPFIGSSSQFHLSTTSLSPTSCQNYSTMYDCQVTITNDDPSQQLNWRATSSVNSITFQPGSSGFIFGGDNWTVSVDVPEPCPGSATLTFTGGSKSIDVSWSCT
jgi:CHAT domain-containing protein